MQIAQLFPLNPDGASQVVWKGCKGNKKCSETWLFRVGSPGALGAQAGAPGQKGFQCVPLPTKRPSRPPGGLAVSQETPAPAVGAAIPLLPVEPRTTPWCCRSSLPRGAQGPLGSPPSDEVHPVMGDGTDGLERWQRDTHHLQTPCAKLPVSVDPKEGK